jgi:hypothetical protein
MRQRHLSAFVVGAMVLAFAMGAPAVADRRSRADSDDSPGGLDIVEVSYGHRRVLATGQLLLRHDIRVQESFDGVDLYAPYVAFYISFDTDRDSGWDRQLLIAAESDGSLYGRMENREGTIVG